ncbi:hypothetical protein [Anabaena azotica]|nr:hypothetical protein [Anabaena azotica]
MPAVGKAYALMIFQQRSSSASVQWICLERKARSQSLTITSII